MAKKLFEKAGLIQVPPTTPRAPAAEVRPVAEAEPSRPKTAPGSMLHFMTAQSAAVKEAETLREQLAEFEGASAARKLDARSIRPSKWANRHEASFEDEAYVELKTEIAASGGNVQPIKVRPAAAKGRGVGPSNPPGATGETSYEIVFGHRRHRACLELGLPVLAVIENVSEQQLFVEMERENRARKDLSAWEQGMTYARALDAGLYASNRQLALAIGRDLGDVGRALSLARLPKVVIDAFKSPLDLQFRWAKPLSDAQQKDPDGLVLRAKALKGKAAQVPPRQIFEALIGVPEGVGRSNPPSGEEVRSGEQLVATIGTDRRGKVQVQFEIDLDDAARGSLIAWLKRFPV